MEILEERLRKRSTESENEIKNRLLRASEEYKYKDYFDCTIVNDDLQTAFNEIEEIAKKFLNL